MTKEYKLLEGKGNAFKNKNKTTDKHPSYTGTILVDGKERWISVWGNKTQKGDTYLSFDVKEKEAKPKEEEKSKYVSQEELDEKFEDDIPFN